MRLFRRTAILAIALAGVVALPAVASANTLWVAQTTPKAPFNSCASPGYNSIQSAISAPGTAIHVCTGTYVEQLQIARTVSIVGDTGAKVKLPAAPAELTTPCDSAKAYDIVVVCGAPGTVTIKNLTVEGPLAGGPDCSHPLFGILVGGGSNLALRESRVENVAPTPINGCQIGTGVEIGRGGQVGTATLIKDTVSGYNKNGITVSEAGSKATITAVDVTSAPTDQIAQNGIQVSFGAYAKIAGATTVTGNECNLAGSCGENGLTQVASTGVLFYGAATGSSVTKSSIDENDIGVYHIDLSGSEPAASQASVTGNTMTKDRYAAVALDQGWATVNANTMTEGAVGIQLLQYAGQAYGPKGTGSGDTVEKMTKYAVEGLSDNEPSDQFGTFTITRSKISGNPGTVSESVFSNNVAKLKLFTTASDS